MAAMDMKSRLLREIIAAPFHDRSLPNFSHYKHGPAVVLYTIPASYIQRPKQCIIIVGRPSMFSSRVTVLDKECPERVHAVVGG